VERTKQTLQIILFFLIGSAILYWVYQKSNAAFIEDCSLKGISYEDCNLLKKVKTDFINSDKFYVTLCIFLFLVSNIFRTLRWQQLLSPLGKKPNFINAFGSVAIGYITNLTIPRSGEVVRAGILTKYENIKFENAFGTIVTERIVDLICLLIVVLLGVLFAGNTILHYFNANFSLEDKVAVIKEHPIILGLVLLSIFGLGVILLYKKNKLIKSKFGIKLLNFFKGLLEGIVSIRKLNNPLLFIFYSIAIWLLYYLMTYLMFFALESTSHLDAITGLVVFIFGSLGMVFPSPGGMGSYHFLIEEALKIYGLDLADSFSFANIMFFAIQIFGIILFGLLAFLYLPFYNKKKNDN
jgi:uncharacterized protein (TIRG00374 family)